MERIVKKSLSLSLSKRRGWALKSQKKSCILYIENLHQPG